MSIIVECRTVDALKPSFCRAIFEVLKALNMHDYQSPMQQNFRIRIRMIDCNAYGLYRKPSNLKSVLGNIT